MKCIHPISTNGQDPLQTSQVWDGKHHQQYLHKYRESIYVERRWPASFSKDEGLFGITASSETQRPAMYDQNVQRTAATSPVSANTCSLHPKRTSKYMPGFSKASSLFYVFPMKAAPHPIKLDSLLAYECAVYRSYFSGGAPSTEDTSILDIVEFRHWPPMNSAEIAPLLPNGTVLQRKAVTWFFCSTV